MKKCSICGDQMKLSYGTKIKRKMLARQMCFHCSYWQDRVERVGSPTQIIIDGHVYQNAGDKPGKTEREIGFMGFGGRRFTWKMLETGKIQTSNDLWSNGKPEQKHFQDLLPNNAEWLKENE